MPGIDNIKQHIAAEIDDFEIKFKESRQPVRKIYGKTDVLALTDNLGMGYNKF